MNNMMLHCHAEAASRAAVGRVDIPNSTSTYKAIPHLDLVELTEQRLTREFPDVDVSWEFGLGKEGQHFFGLAVLNMDDEELGMMVAMRNSYDKSMTLAIAMGAACFICDNMAISGSSVTMIRKHTKNAWDDVKSVIFRAVAEAQDSYDAISLELNEMKSVGVSTNRGYEHIGRALGTGVLTSTQANVAIKEWGEPSHEEFADRNAYCLYQAVTEAGKRGQPGRVIDRYARFHSFFRPEGGELLDADYSVVSALSA